MAIKISKRICAVMLVAGAFCASFNTASALSGIMADSSNDKETLQHHIKITHPVLTPDDQEQFARGTFTLSNEGDVNRLLLNITSPVCTDIMANHMGQTLIETTEGEKNIFTNLTIPHASVIQFPRDGYHFICRNFRNPQTQTAPFTFHFSDGDITVSFKIRN